MKTLHKYIVFAFCFILILGCKNLKKDKIDYYDLIALEDIGEIHIDYPNFFCDFDKLNSKRNLPDTYTTDFNKNFDSINDIQAIILMGGLISEAFYFSELENNECVTDKVDFFNELSLKLDSNKLSNFSYPLLHRHHLSARDSITLLFYSMFLYNDNNTNTFIFKNSNEYNSLFFLGFILNKWHLIFNSFDKINPDIFLKDALFEIKQVLIEDNFRIKLYQDYINEIDIYVTRIDSIVKNDFPYKVDSVTNLIIRDGYVDNNGMDISENKNFQSLYIDFIKFLNEIRNELFFNIN